MANTGVKGIDVKQTGTALIFDAFLQTSAGALVTTGTTNLYIWEVQSDGSIKTYDFASNTFKTTTVTTEAQALTYQKSNNATTDTGYWTFALSTLTGFTVGATYRYRINNSGASPTDQVRAFQYGGDQGDLIVVQGLTGQALLSTDVEKWFQAQVGNDGVGNPIVGVVSYGGHLVSVDANLLPAVGAQAINGVLASSVTTINANLGTMQPVNFTGTAASAKVNTNLLAVNGTAQTARDLGNALPTAAPATSGGLPTVGTGSGQIQPDGTTGSVGVSSITTAVKQALAEIHLGTQGTVWYVATTGLDTNDGKSWATAFLTVHKASTVAIAGDVVRIGPGTFAEGNVLLNWADGVSQLGAGIDVTTVTGTPNIVSTGVFWRGSGNGTTQDLTIQADTAPGAFSAPWGQSSAFGHQNPFANAVLRRVKLVGYSDGFYVAPASATTCSYTAYECIVQTGFDATQQAGNGAVQADYYDCQITCTSVSGTNNRCGGLTTAAGTGRVRMFGGSITIDSSTNTNNPTSWCVGSAGGSVLMEVYGVAMKSVGGSNGATYDIFQTGTTTISVFGCTYDPAKASGTLTVQKDMPTKVDGVVVGAITASAFAAGALSGNVQLAANGLDLVLVESGITGSASLVNDAAQQLTSINARQAFALMLSAAAGITSGAGGANFTIHAGGLATKTRVAASTDAQGDRTALTLTVPT